MRGLDRVSGGRGLRDEGTRPSLRRSVLHNSLLRCVLLGACALSIGACVKPMVSSEYEPSSTSARLSADEARDYLSTALGPECTRLAKDGALPTGVAKVTVQVTPAGDVLKSHLTERTGDARIDELFGTTAARMKFDANGTQSSAYTGRMRMGYSCNGDAAVATIDLF